MSRGWELKSDKALLVTSGLLFVQCNLGRRFHVPAPHILPNHVFTSHLCSSLIMGHWHSCGHKPGLMVGKKRVPWSFELTCDSEGSASIHPAPPFPAAPHTRRGKVAVYWIFSVLLYPRLSVLTRLASCRTQHRTHGQMPSIPVTSALQTSGASA